jgi:hypothetical protein
VWWKFAEERSNRRDQIDIRYTGESNITIADARQTSRQRSFAGSDTGKFGRFAGQKFPGSREKNRAVCGFWIGKFGKPA